MRPIAGRAAVALATLASGCGNAARPSSGSATRSLTASTVTVRSGDSFFAIGSRVGVDPYKLAAHNGMTIHSYIYPGDTLKVPGATRTSSGPKTTTAPRTSSSASSSTKEQRIVKEAMKHVGKPYVWGAAGPNSFDCSGFVHYVMNRAGRSGYRSNSRGYAAMSKPVSKSKMRPGDLVFVYSPVSHVGIYIGNNKMVHASNRTDGVKVSNMSSYRNVTWFAGRLS